VKNTIWKWSNFYILEENKFIHSEANQFIAADIIHAINNFNSIHIGTPTIKICDQLNIASRDFSNAINIESSIFPGASNTSYTEAEQLFELLNSKKDVIDNILGSQPVYAIGPEFQEGHSIPHIVCWTTEPLDTSIIEQLKETFQNRFEVVIMTMNQENHTHNRESLNSNIHFNKSKSNNSSSNKGYSGDKSANRKEPGDEGDGFGDNGKLVIEGETQEFDGITISSKATVQVTDKHVSQDFGILAKFNAKVNPDLTNSTKSILEFIIDVNCTLDHLLSDSLPSFKKLGYGYFLDAVNVKVSPISQDTGNETLDYIQKDIKQPTQPKQSNQNNEIINFKFNSLTTEKIMEELYGWNIIHSGINHDLWEYSYFGGDDDINARRRTHFPTHRHRNKWHITKKSGFCITIKQALRFNLRSKNWILFLKHLGLRSQLIKCTKMVHTLNITFNNLEDFNNKFIELGKLRTDSMLKLTGEKREALSNKESDEIKITRSAMLYNKH
ncbi:24529_t:CDS:1, partial [Gigaspora rosea]